MLFVHSIRPTSCVWLKNQKGKDTNFRFGFAIGTSQISWARQNQAGNWFYIPEKEPTYPFPLWERRCQKKAVHWKDVYSYTLPKIINQTKNWLKMKILQYWFSTYYQYWQPCSRPLALSFLDGGCCCSSAFFFLMGHSKINRLKFSKEVWNRFLNSLTNAWKQNKTKIVWLYCRKYVYVRFYHVWL